MFWIAEHYSVETDLPPDGDKWAWLNSPTPAEETECLAHAMGGVGAIQRDSQWRRNLPNEQTGL